MRYIGCLPFLFYASTAWAVMPPGPPPWACHAIAACISDNGCVRLSLPLIFRLVKISDAEKIFRVEGFNDYERNAVEVPSLESAENLLKTFAANERTPIILIPNSRIADAHSFWLHTIATRGTGQHHIIDEKMLVACQSIRE